MYLFFAAVNTGTSLVLSSLLSVLVFAGMQMFSKQLGSTEWLTILGGFLGSALFICSLTVSFLVAAGVELLWATSLIMKLQECVIILSYAAFYNGDIILRLCFCANLIYS